MSWLGKVKQALAGTGREPEAPSAGAELPADRSSVLDELRALLYDAGLFDVRVVPGMTVPENLTARFSLHSKARIDAIRPEFPDQTTITRVAAPLRDHQVYEVAFRKLGENMLTIEHDGGRRTFLEFFVTEPLETLIKKRASFLVDRQQIRDPSKWWNGVYGIYDMRARVTRTIEDPDIFSRQDIIRNELDRNVASKRIETTDAVRTVREGAAQVDLDLLGIDRRKAGIAIDRAKKGLDALEIEAPHDGILVYQRDWRGEMKKVGDSVWVRGRGIYRAAGVPELAFELEETAWFEGDRIRRLEDRYEPAEREALARYLAAHGAKLGLGA